MADQDLTNAITNLQQANEQSSVSLEALVQNVSTGQLGTGKFDAQNAEFLRQIEIQMRTNPNLDKSNHKRLLSEITSSISFSKFVTDGVLIPIFQSLLFDLVLISPPISIKRSSYSFKELKILSTA